MKHISIEGMDGVGKSTTCKLLSERLGYKWVEKPMHYITDGDVENWPNYFKVRDEMNTCGNHVLSSWFYGLGSIYMYHKFKDANIITDRHLCSNYAWSGDNTNKIVYETLLEVLGKPTLTVILYAPGEVIQNRMKNRDENDSDLKKINISEKIYEKMIYFCELYKLPYLVVDTSKLNPEQIVDLVIKKLGE